MPRRVAVILDLDSAKYLAGAGKVAAVTKAVDAQMGALDRSVDAVDRDMAELAVTTQVAKAQVDDLGDEALGSAVALSRLGAEIDRTKARVKELRMQFARTGGTDEGLFGDLKKEERRLQRLSKVFNSIGDGAGRGLLQSLAENIGQIPSKLRGGAILAAVGLGAVMAPFLGGVISSAVLGTVGAGGVIGGAILAAKDPRVQGAWKDLGKDLLAQLTDASEGFRQPLIASAAEFGKAFRESKLTDVLRESAQLVKPLTAGIAGFVRELGPGLKAAIEAAMPTFRVLASELPELGKSISKMLESIAAAGPEAALAMRDFLKATGAVIEELGTGLKTLSEFYVLTRGLGPAIVENDAAMAILVRGSLPALLDKLTQAGPRTATWVDGLGELAPLLIYTDAAVEKAAEGLTALGEAADKKAADGLDELGAALRRNVIDAFSLEEAQDAVANAVADLTKQLKDQREAHIKGAGALLGNTQAARDNREKVRDLVSKYQDLIVETDKVGGSTVGLRKKLEDQLVKMGFARGVARDYALALGEIPKDVKSKITLEDQKARQDINEVKRLLIGLPDGTAKVSVPGATRSTAQVRELQNAIRALHDKEVSITITRHYRGGAPLPQRWGGITEHAQSGLLHQAAMFNPPTRYAFAEPATKGEAFIPRMGDMGRSRAIAEHVVKNWLGGSVSWGSGAGPTYIVNVGVAPGADMRAAGKYVFEALKTYQQSNGKRFPL